MKNRVKKFVKDNERVIIVSSYVAAGVVMFIYFNKKVDGMKIDHGHMSDDENAFTVHLKNGQRHAFYRPGTKP